MRIPEKPLKKGLNPFQSQPIAQGHLCWGARHLGVAGEGLRAGLLDLGTLLVGLRLAWDSFAGRDRRD